MESFSRRPFTLWRRWALVSVCALAALCQCGSAFQNKCQRGPDSTAMPKTRGDGGFEIKISGNPEMYVPGEVYTVSLQGPRHSYSVQKFTGFMLVVESSESSERYGIQSVGTFQLYGDVLTMHSDGCPNTVIQTSHILKSEIQVLWTAPPLGSGCLRFKATVVEQRDLWYMDEGELTKDLCEEVQESDVTREEVVYDCCSCNEAKYEVTFEGLWSRQTHPKDFPSNEWLTHFSDIIGASHSNKYRVWAYGGLASDGLKQVAEWGSTRTLESELKRQSGHIRTIIKARGLWYPNVNGKTFAVFRVDNKHHLMSLVSMLGPSPDWVVGVSALELCLRNCSWIGQRTLNLYPWDAGTDSGVTYSSANAPSIPRQFIRRITNSSPNDPKSPFYDPRGLPMKPLAKLTITRQRVYEKTCSKTGVPGGSEGGRYNPVEEDYDESGRDRPECRTTEWSEFGQCSATCGQGKHTRTRVYTIPMKAVMMRCTRQMSSHEYCSAPTTYCDGPHFGRPNPTVLVASECRTKEWSSWSTCSATCGQGVMQRTRRYVNRMGRKRCNQKTKDTQPCTADVLECDPSEEVVDPECATTQWSAWSMCSASCATGVRGRNRYFLVPTATQESCGVEISNKMSCKSERADCTVQPSEAKEVCLLEKKTGSCRGYYPRWYYDAKRRICMQFIYGGCRGNMNNFSKFDECTRICELVRDELHKDSDDRLTNSRQHSQRNSLNRKHDGNQSADSIFGGLTSESQIGPGAPVDCVMGKWGNWSGCSVCGSGWTEMHRRIQVEPQNGGKPCHKKMRRRHKCKSTRCNSPNHKLQIMNAIFDPYTDHTSPILPSSNQHPKYMPPPHHQVSPVESEEELMKQIDTEDTNVDCVMGNWGPWTPCSHSCGSESLQQRVRSIVVKARGGGIPCGPSLERRYCTLPPCPHHRG